MKKITIKSIQKKKNKLPITCLTSYTKPIAEIVGKHCDIILVGDSLGMVLYGMKTTRDVTLDMMISHAKSVRLGAKNNFIVVDMPYKTYLTKKNAYANARKIIKMTKCDAVKLEGGREIETIIKHLVKKGIPVMGHVGLLPQYTKNFKTRGKGKRERKKILNDAISITKAGVFAIVIECVVENLAKEITKEIAIPTIGIGASRYCDGQVLVIDDMIGLSNFYPKFVKQYSKVRKIVDKSIREYCKDVKTGRFPFKKNIYRS